MTTQVLSILNGSYCFLQTRRTNIKAWMSLNFVKTPSPIIDEAPLDHLIKLMGNVVTTLASTFLIGSSSFFQWAKCCYHSSAFTFDWIFFILPGNIDSHKFSDGFEFWPDRTLDCGVSCP